MKTRTLSAIGVTTLLAAIAGFMVVAQPGQSQEKKADHSQHSEMMQSCAKACSDCQRACDACATHCADQIEEGKKEHRIALKTCQDCATICSAAAQIVARGGPFSNPICTACAEACSFCAKECEKFPDDKPMQDCADACHKCESSCRAMITHSAR